MRIERRRSQDDAGADLTPMIDMTFQLIAFFMIVINFTDAEQNQEIQLPASTLAKPPEAPPKEPITLQLTARSTVFFRGQEVPIDEIKDALLLERDRLEASGLEAADALVIIRADREAKTGEVQKLMQVAQESEFERFALRAKEDKRY